MIKEAVPLWAEFSASEKLQLLEELWDDLATSPSTVPVPEWHKAELARRYEEYLRDPVVGSEWTEVRDRLGRMLS